MQVTTDFFQVPEPTHTKVIDSWIYALDWREEIDEILEQYEERSHKPPRDGVDNILFLILFQEVCGSLERIFHRAILEEKFIIISLRRIHNSLQIVLIFDEKQSWLVTKIFHPDDIESTPHLLNLFTWNVYEFMDKLSNEQVRRQ